MLKRNKSNKSVLVIQKTQFKNFYSYCMPALTRRKEPKATRLFDPLYPLQLGGIRKAILRLITTIKPKRRVRRRKRV